MNRAALAASSAYPKGKLKGEPLATHSDLLQSTFDNFSSRVRISQTFSNPIRIKMGADV